MQQIAIARTGLQVSRIAYGCMQLSRAWDDAPPTEAERRATAAMIDGALAQGINLFDHADIYARGKCERLFGETLRQRPGLRAQIVLQSKCGIRFAGDPRPDSPARYDFSHGYLVASVEGILQRLQTEYLDLLLLHRPDPLMEPEEVARAFDDLRRGGKVRHFGVSNHSGAQISLLQRHVDVPLVVNQVEVSLLHPHLISEGVMINQTGGSYTAAASTLDYCREHDILVQAWSPLASGRLAGDPSSLEPGLRSVAAGVHAMAAELGTSAEAILIAWLLRHPAGLQPVVGTTSPARLAACCDGERLRLSREQWYTLFEAARGQRVP
jgi:predicted oxidoreductase